MSKTYPKNQKIDNTAKELKSIKDIISAMYVKNDIPFMDAIVLQLSKVLEADHVFVGEIQNHRFSVKTLAHCMDGAIADNFEYNLKDTPCELVYDGKLAIYPEEITRLFPSDKDLQDLNIEGYSGIPLFNDEQVTFGAIVALYREPIKNPDFVSSVMKLFANQVANEIERQRSEKKTEEQAVFYQSIIDGVDGSIMVIDKDFNVVIMNQTAKKLKQEAKAIKCYKLSHNRDTPCDGLEHPCPLEKVLESKEVATVVHNHIDSDGNPIVVEITSTPLWDKEKNLIGVVESAKDITEHIETKQELQNKENLLHYQANHDKLTGLANRVLFIDRLNQDIKKAKRYNKKVAVLIIDIDNFKSINDSLGFKVGDKVLKSVAKMLEKSIRQIDTVANFGADEFAVIMSDIDDINTIISAVNRFMNEIKEPINYEEHTLYVTSSIGVSIYPDDSITTDSLLKNADTAMHKAKEDGSNIYKFYKEEMSERAFERIFMETGLRDALKKEEFVVYYQPQVNGDTNRLIGMEALVRWQHPTMGLVPPDKFIPLAESTGLIVQLDRFVMKTAMTQLAQWYRDGLNPGKLAMNLAVKQFQKQDFIEVFKELIKETKCNPDWLELEVTESQIMTNPQEAIKVLKKISDLGIELAVDDFGTGYSSLAYLKRLPIDKLKIDQEFIKNLPNDEEDSAIAKAVIALSKSLNLKVIAEGVETKEQRDFIVENGCENIQGYFYSRPVPAVGLEEMLKRGFKHS